MTRLRKNTKRRYPQAVFSGSSRSRHPYLALRLGPPEPAVRAAVLDPGPRRCAARAVPVQSDRYPLGALTPEGSRCVTQRSAAEFHHASGAIGGHERAERRPRLPCACESLDRSSCAGDSGNPSPPRAPDPSPTPQRRRTSIRRMCDSLRSGIASGDRLTVAAVSGHWPMPSPWGMPVSAEGTLIGGRSTRSVVSPRVLASRRVREGGNIRPPSRA